ncbi:MAG: ComF family protein [bacterium]|nr:ComF family protein [bacterium]
MWGKLKELKETVLDVILPRSCLGCGQEGRYVCEQCDLFLSEATSLFRQEGLEELVSAWEYDGLIKDIILRVKYDGMFDAIGELVEKAFATKKPYIPEDAMITFVPMFKKKEKQRGFNQAELIAQKIREMTGAKMLPLLEKVKDTSSQTKLDKTERLANVRGSFRRKEGIVYPSNVLLVDDVWTSGATMKECAKVLRRSGVKRVFGFTLARTI